MSDSPGLVDFAFGLVNSVLNLPDGQVNFLGKFKLQKDCNQSCLSKRVLGASWNDLWASTCQLQLARMTGCKTDFLCTLVMLVTSKILETKCINKWLKKYQISKTARTKGLIKKKVLEFKISQYSVIASKGGQMSLLQHYITKGVFRWGWGTPGGWGNPLRWTLWDCFRGRTLIQFPAQFVKKKSEKEKKKKKTVAMITWSMVQQGYTTSWSIYL